MQDSNRYGLPGNPSVIGKILRASNKTLTQDKQEEPSQESQFASFVTVATTVARQLPSG
jgi:hypothetical protein